MHQTPLHEAHLAAGARMVDFAGWEMPINYGSQIEEHHQVRKDAGMFDVSHMTVLDLRGSGARAFLARLLANDVGRLQSRGKALYSCMLNERGGVIDDLITYFMDDEWFRVIVNAATHDKDLDWLNQQKAGFDVSITELTDLAMIAVQGPRARAAVHGLLPAELVERAEPLEPFNAVSRGRLFIGRTGYTGEDGYEVLLPAGEAPVFWDGLLAEDVKPCGLGARDTLRLEAGMNLYGQDMDEDVTPLESGLAWTVAMKDDREFIGREALERQKAAGVKYRLTGLVLEGRGVLRHGQTVLTEAGEGETTSGSFSPTLQRAIAFARLPVGATGNCEVDIRGKRLAARIVKLPFVRNGKPCNDVL